MLFISGVHWGAQDFWDKKKGFGKISQLLKIPEIPRVNQQSPKSMRSSLFRLLPTEILRSLNLVFLFLCLCFCFLTQYKYYKDFHHRSFI